MDREDCKTTTVEQADLYRHAVHEFGRALDRLSAGYESDPDKRRDLCQEIHLQLWKSLALYDERCSLKTWAFRVAHNTAVSYVAREHRMRAKLVSLEDLALATAADPIPDVDRLRAFDRLFQLIHELKPLDRQIMISYPEDLDAGTIADIVGLSPANIAMKIHRIKTILKHRFREVQLHG